MVSKKGKPPKRQKRLAGGPPKLSAYNRFVKKFMKGRKGKATANMKAAARAWKAQGGKPKRSKPTSTRARVRRAPAKKGGTRKVGRGGINQAKIFKIVRLAALAAPAVDIMMTATSNDAKVKAMMKAYTGFDSATNKFDFANLWRGYGPTVGAALVTYGIPKLVGIIRGL